MAGQRLVHSLRLYELNQTQLGGVVAVFFLRPALHHDAWPGLQHRTSDQIAVLGKDLRHAQLDSDDPVNRHFLFSLSQLASSFSGTAGYWLRIAEIFTTYFAA